ncbi:hypothetical protein ACFLVN_04380 [Chloroflexota bacterium]
MAFDMHGRLLEANPAALTTFGVNKNIIGQSVEYLSSLSPVLERQSSTDSRGVGTKGAKSFDLIVVVE